MSSFLDGCLQLLYPLFYPLTFLLTTREEKIHITQFWHQHTPPTNSKTININCYDWRFSVTFKTQQNVPTLKILQNILSTYLFSRMLFALSTASSISLIIRVLSSLSWAWIPLERVLKFKILICQFLI